MSSQRKAPAGKGPAGKGGKESKAPKAPIVTPQALGILFGILAIIMAGVLYDRDNKAKAEINKVSADIQSQQSLITTYRIKGSKKDEADKLNKALRAKLDTLDYLFLEDQNSLVPFFEDTFFPLLLSSNMLPTEDAKVTVNQYTFQINMAMNPMDTIPTSQFFENAQDVFKLSYIPEQNGIPIEEPLDTRPGEFMTPYHITLEGWQGSFRDVKNFVASLQRRTNDKLMTVHCFKSDESKLFGLLRTSTVWKMQLTVYFMNSEQPASGDAPPAPPGSQSC